MKTTTTYLARFENGDCTTCCDSKERALEFFDWIALGSPYKVCEITIQKNWLSQLPSWCPGFKPPSVEVKDL